MRLAVAVLLLSVVVASSAHGAPGTPLAFDRELGLVARESLWQALSEPRRARREVLRVDVRCYRDKSNFEQAFRRRFGFSGHRVIAYYAGGSDVHLRNGTCARVHEFLGGRVTVFTAAAFAILLHESLHRQGVRDERLTTCFANEAVRWGAIRYGFGEEQALRARNLAFTYTKLYSPPGYRMGKPNCLLLARRQDWTAFRERG